MRDDGFRRLSHRARWLELRVALTMISIFFAGCGDPRSVGMDPVVDFPVSAQYDARRNDLLVASYENGVVVRLPLSNLHKPRVLLGTEEMADHRVLRIRIDERRDRLWLLDFSAVYVYELETGRFINRIALPSLLFYKKICFSDMAVDRTGAAFISSAVEPRLFRIDGETHALSVLDIDVGTDADKDFGFNALTFTDDGKVLFAASATLGKLWKIDLEQERAVGINISAPIRGACALKAVERKAPLGDPRISIYVAGGFRGGVKRVELVPGVKRIWTTGVSIADDLSVTTDLVAIRNLLMIVHAPLTAHADFGGDGVPKAVKIMPMFQPLM